MTVPRQRMALGAWGNIALTGYVYDQNGKRQPMPDGARKADTWRARTKVRDLDGKVRDVERWEPTKPAARTALLAHLRERVTPPAADADADLSVSSFGELADRLGA